MNPVVVPQLSRRVLALHRALIDAQLHAHAQIFGRTDDPFARLKLVREDLAFEWVRPLTAALVELDEASEADLAEAPRRLPLAVSRVEALISGGDAAFAERYRELLRDVPEVAVAHGAVKAELGPRAA